MSPDPDIRYSASLPDRYLGVWRRRLLRTPHEEDRRSLVLWLQTPRWHADLRLPPSRPDFSGVDRLEACSDGQLAWLARQQGFLGITEVEGDLCTWHHHVDIQPPHGRRDIGHMTFQGDSIVERGVDADYLEVWERLPHSLGPMAALKLERLNGKPPGRKTWLLVAGDFFMWVRERAQPLPAADDLASLIARDRPPRAQRLAWLDLEISFGHRNGPCAWRIEHSSLPFREGQYVVAGALRREGDLVEPEDGTQRWRILDCSPDFVP
jgi:hypothetical protein